MKLITELNKFKGRSFPKLIYFLWRNGLSNTKTDYSKLTEEEFINKYLDGNAERLMYFKQWERTEEYQRLANIMLMENMRVDFLEIYKSVRDKAIQGDDKAIKTFLMLQKEVKKNLNKKKVDDEEQQEEDISLDLEE